MIAHRRPHYLEQVLAVLKNSNVRAVYISIDGYREDINHEIDLVKQCREVAAKFACETAFEVKMRAHKRNIGGAANIISSIDWMFEGTHFGIILEEDCLPNLSFFDYMDQALESLEKTDEIWVASGYRPPYLGSDQRALLIERPMTWGWGTTKSKWDEMRVDIMSSALKIPIRKLFFKSASTVFWEVGARRSELGLVDAWDIPLAAAMKRKSRSSLIPPVNLVSNIGVDSLGLNTIGASHLLETPTENWIPSSRDWPEDLFDQIVIDTQNKLFEEKVANLKFRHSVTPIIKYFLQLLNPWKRGRGSLPERVSAVNPNP